MPNAVCIGICCLAEDNSSIGEFTDDDLLAIL